MANTKVLVGKILFHMDEDTHCASRFTQDLGNSLFLAVRLIPDTGEDLPLQHIVNLADLTEDDQIFDDFSTMQSYYESDEAETKFQSNHQTIH